MSAAKLTPAQGWTLERCLRGEIRRIGEIDVRVRTRLEARGLLVWQNDPERRFFGTINREGTVDAVHRGGCGECDDCQEIMVEPSQVQRGLYCPFAKATGGEQ